MTAKPIDTIKEIRESDEEDTTPFKINQNERAKSSHIMRRRHKFVDKVHKLKSSHKCMCPLNHYFGLRNQQNKTVVLFHYSMLMYSGEKTPALNTLIFSK